MLWPLTSAPFEKSLPCTRMYICKPLWKKWHGEATPRENPPASKIRASSFAVSHTRLAALLWGLAIGCRPRGLHQRRSGLESRQRWRSRKGPKEVLPRRSVRPIYRAPLYTPDVNGSVGLRRYLLVVSTHLRPTGSRSCPRFRFGGVLVHLTVPQILYLFLTSNFDLMWVQWSALDIIFIFPLLLGFFVCIHRKKCPASAEVGDVAAGPSPQRHTGLAVIVGWPTATGSRVPTCSW